MRLTTLLFVLGLCLLSASVCEAQFYTLPGSFNYSLNSINQVMDVTPDGKLAVALRNDPSGHPALLTTFNPISGTAFDSKTFGFGPLEVRLVQVGAGWRAVVLTSEGGPSTIYLFDISPTGQLTQLAKTQLTTSINDVHSSLVLSSSAQVGFVVVAQETPPDNQLVSFSLVDGSVLNRLPVSWGFGHLEMTEAGGLRKIAYQSGLNSVGIIDATNAALPVKLGTVTLHKNSNNSGTVDAGMAFSADGHYLFTASQFFDFSVVDVNSISLLASIGGDYKFGRVRVSETGTQRLVAVLNGMGEGFTNGSVLLIDATDPTKPTITNQLAAPLDSESDLQFLGDGTRLFVTTAQPLTSSSSLLSLEVPTLKKVWEQQVIAFSNGIRQQQVLVYGREVLGAWNGNSGINSSIFGAFPADFPNISISDATVTESNTATSANFTVTLSAPSAHRVSVMYRTTDGTAMQNFDYSNVTGTVTFEPGETQKTITVPILIDSMDEFDETFTLNLLNPVIGIIVKSQGTGTINDDDPPPSISINDASVTEGNTGTRNVTFTVSLSSQSGKPIAVDYATSDNTATAGSDYVAATGTLVFTPGQTQRTFSVAVNGDITNEANETFNVTLTNQQNSTLARAQGTGTIVNDDTPVVALSSNVYSVNEGVASGVALVTVNRSGDPTIPVSVDYTTSDQSGLTPCQTNNNGAASERCDYATAAGTLRFAAGETSKTIQIPIINDAYVEPSENFNITLKSSQGALLGASSATVTIINDDTTAPAQNPIADQSFFIKQQYIDFLGRVAEPAGFDFWMNRMNNCPQGQTCDRVDTSQRFFQSDEFQQRGFLVYRLYDAVLGRLPKYAEFVPDVARLNGFQTVAEQRQSRDAYLLDFINKQEFRNLYGAYLSSDGLTAIDATGFVNALCARAGITPASKQTLINNLQSGARTPAQTLEDFIQTPELSNVGTLYYDRGFITMQYFGYLRRDPEQAGFDFWVSQLIGPNAPHKQDYRFMVGGFLQSDEYGFRFGQTAP